MDEPAHIQKKRNTNKEILKIITTICRFLTHKNVDITVPSSAKFLVLSQYVHFVRNAAILLLFEPNIIELRPDHPLSQGNTIVIAVIFYALALSVLIKILSARKVEK